jgi:hypothetical protein
MLRRIWWIIEICGPGPVRSLVRRRSYRSEESGSMKFRVACVLSCALSVLPMLRAAEPARPRSGKVEIFREADLKPGMQATAWTVFAGTEPEPVPVEIIGIMKNAWGPKQDIILGKMGGKAIRTNVAGGMSGSPVYFRRTRFAESLPSS